MEGNTTKRKIFTYDAVLDEDIDEFFKKVPLRKDSQYIRTAIRLLIRFMEANEGSLNINEKGINNLNQMLGIAKDNRELRGLNWYDRTDEPVPDFDKPSDKKAIKTTEEKPEPKNRSNETNENDSEEFIDLDKNFLDDLGK